MAKKRKRRKAPPGVDPNEKRRERLEARRQAKAAAVAAQRRREMRSRLLRIAVYAGLFALAVWFFFFRVGDLPSEIGDHEVKSFATSGEAQHEEPPISYAESPPVAGPHADTPLGCGSYAQPVANENLVHSLEHGAVYVLYSPDLPVPQIRTLEQIAADHEENVLVAPYEGEMQTPVAVGSWGHRMDLDEVDEEAINEYVDEFQSKITREASIGCPNEQDQRFQPDREESAEPGAGETPAPAATSG